MSSAQALLIKADKKASSSTGWFSSQTAKYEEAGDLYQQAANLFKLDKHFREAGDCFAREAECRETCKESVDAGNAWWNASKAYKKGHPDRESWPASYCRFLSIVKPSFRSCDPSIDADDHTPHAKWSLQTGSGQGKRNRADLPSRSPRSP
jgi:hypothetical protein